MPFWLGASLAVVSILAHAYFSLILYPRLLEKYPRFITVTNVWLIACALMAVPILGLLMGLEWKTVIWWCCTPSLGVVVLLVKHWIDQGQRDIQELERLKYPAKGA